MDEMQLRFLTTQALYGKDLQERSAAIRQLLEGTLTRTNIEAIGVRLELAIGCQDEYVRSAAAMLLEGLVERLPVPPTITKHLLDLSRSPKEFSREAALRAIKRLHERGQALSPQDLQVWSERLEEARHTERAEFILSLFDEGA